MTVGQALVEFLANQWTVDGDVRERTIPGIFGIFGHGNVAGVGQAIKQLHVEQPGLLPYHQARNEQAMVHEAVGFARMHRRRATYASTASVGPGAANMLTAAALATTNRLPALLLPSDTFATRTTDPVLQQIELPHDTSLQVTDAFRPLSRYFDRVERPEQLFSIALAAMRVLTDPAETGAVTIALPEDVQAEEFDVPVAFLQPREWHIRRPLPERGPLERAVAAIRAGRRPVIVAGGGVLYSDAADELRAFVEATGIPVGTSQAGGGSLVWDHPQYLGGIGATGTAAANAIAAQADVVIGIGTRYSDFTTASRTAFQNPDVTFVNVNVAAFDAYKHGSQLPLIADAREALVALTESLTSDTAYVVEPGYASEIASLKAAWDAAVDGAFAPSGADLPGQPEIIGAVQSVSDPRDVVIQAAGSLPGDLHKLWRVRDELGYHVEYAFSCMGYEIAGGIGVRRGAPDRDAIVMVGDGSYLMLHTELVTAVAEGIKIIVVLIQNHGYASIGHLSETVGSERFGTKYRYLDETESFENGEPLPVDLAANARSYGVDVIEVQPGPDSIEDLKAALRQAKANDHTTLVHINSDPLVYAPEGDGWWDVPVAQTSTLPSTQAARAEYEQQVATQRPLLG
ncbi:MULTISPECIES: 3D-(3,5/4)-trihydroxycyclohexane-1,2-dione acylhydrolase (decyclizing) [Curtobacterium]|jgi:3D-(3,5/4)-trihydroxycyclohexane-1,2-dione acylhydrolase (decyclizing)|uniref:3D-(3,5/4)-trihydroxycyclohexane-1,2-dione acylhydrolase (decyclizing) n=1 Tax=Curtobacterium TaxID=2034 RepID=UPI000D9AE1B2|nr:MULTISPECIES: 3D-(3,5/4)-trihydroxycyclohexane-1,2-dione acylhydrolase (decyclizing) [Curtobacterium]MBF4592545.1 3D-(3,5/4)-trihydroxycyclohexane-1,2-dione acylhydrolase (decyclizing) [Curtobacterium flaccumfaciens]MBO9046699.1 3D-(3,5/4)-trihydroxycyclohexane-1,2-dione acylhydrolase (decyclizing) [Curtobacterium flaccumfaciens pv. flaccumfaciens]MBO9056160.1 3D-(3,5/4)-trihydroxycyclohexane-1,2-dione acylhydrolase (decyclizing) [Curtobacterium flaccumfaciens pv. flaccumfaciens]MBT1669575.1